MWPPPHPTSGSKMWCKTPSWKNTDATLTALLRDSLKLWPINEQEQEQQKGLSLLFQNSFLFWNYKLKPLLCLIYAWLNCDTQVLCLCVFLFYLSAHLLHFISCSSLFLDIVSILCHSSCIHLLLDMLCCHVKLKYNNIVYFCWFEC